MYNTISNNQSSSITEKMEENLSDNLCNAIKKEDLKEVIDLISKGVNVNESNQIGMFPLQMAIKKESKEIIKELIDKGANVNIEIQNKTLLEYAMEESNVDIFKLLMEKGATIIFHKDNAENTYKILQYIIKNGMLEVLQSNKEININFQTNDGHTLLIMAAQEGQLEIVKFLFNMGINVNARTSRNSTALHFAINSFPTALEIVKFLIDNGAEIEAENSYGYTPLQLALYDHRFELAKLLVEKGADVNRIYNNTHYARMNLGGTLLHWACRSYNTDDAIKFLIENGANINATERDGRTPLFILVKHSADPEMIKFLVKNGADLNNRGGGNALYWAIYMHDVKSQILLIELGTDVNGNIDSFDDLKAPLHLVYDVSVIKLLVDKGADVNIKDKYGSTPLHYVSKVSSLKYLVENGANIHAKNNDGDTPLHTAKDFFIAEYLIEKGADVNISNNAGYTPLHFAKNVNIARHLIEQGANIKAVAKDGKSILHSLVETHSDSFSDEISVLINFLVEKGVDVNATDKNGDTPLHLCEERYNEYLVKILLLNGANISATNIENKKPTDYDTISRVLRYIGKLFDDIKNNASWKDIESLLINRIRFLNITFDDLKITALHSMVMHGNESMVKNFFKTLKYRRNMINYIDKYKLVNARDKNQWMPLHYAAQRGNEQIVLYLLDNGAVYNNADASNEPILLTDNIKIKNILELTEKMFEYVKLGNEEKVAECIQIQKEIINARQNNGDTPLHVAIYHGHFNIAKLLLKNEVDFSLINDTGNTVLHFATVKDNEAIIETLLNKAKNLQNFINLKTVNGMTALHMAAKNNSMKLVKLFLSNGAIYNAKNEDGQMPIDFSTDKFIIDFFQFVHELFEDAKYGRTEIIDKLKSLDSDDFHVVKKLYNRQMYKLKDILECYRYDNFVEEFLKLENALKLNLKYLSSQKTEENECFSESDDDLGFGLFD